MARSKKTLDKGTENVAAALDQLDASSAAVSRATGIVRSRLDQLEDLISELENRLSDTVDAHKVELQSMREEYRDENTALRTRLEICETKLRKVQQTLE